MNKEDIRSILQLLAKEELGWSTELPSTSLSQSLDSMQKISLVVAIEDRFEICFEPEEEEYIDTIAELISFIHKKIHKRADL